MKYEKVTQTVDGYNYHFYVNPSIIAPDGRLLQIEQPGYAKEMIAYAQMAKRFMNKPFNSPLDIVGNYEWHEEFPYEANLFNDANDQPLVDFSTAKVVDFGCGPGRMVNRAKKLFPQVDGIDISEYAIAYAREHFEGSNFYVSSGIDMGDAPEETYDIVFSTIAIQHIPVKSIRMNLLKAMSNILKPGGYMSIQVAYHPTRTAGVWSQDTEHASYDSDFWNAKATNGHADMVINQNDIPQVHRDLSEIYENVTLKLANVDKLYGNLNGKYHAPYWAEDWLFIQGRKPL